MTRIIVFITLIASLGCSSGGGGGSGVTSTNYPHNAFSVLADADLPTCSGDIIGRLYYIESSNSFKVCKTAGWTQINVKGDNGSDGTNGTNGTNGISISSVTLCTKTVSSRIFDYTAIYYSSGDKFIYCSISDTLGTYSAFMPYRSTMGGYSTESCILTYDLESSGSGFWNFTLNSGTRSTLYSDVGSASNGTTVTYSTSDCVTN